METKHDNVLTEHGADRVEIVVDHGRVVSINSGRNVLTISNPEGGTELTVTMSPSGPVVSLLSGTLRLEALETLTIAARDIHLETARNFVEYVGGNKQTTVQGEHATEADSQTVKARRGDVFIYANDDVRLDGERIRNNC